VGCGEPVPGSGARPGWQPSQAEPSRWQAGPQSSQIQVLLPLQQAHPCPCSDPGDAPDWGSRLAASRSPPACPQVTVPISIPLQRARAVLQESKQARKHASQLATRANETQRELSRQERVAEKLRGELEEAHQVSRVASGRLCVPQPGMGFSHNPTHREQPSFWAPLYGEYLGDVPGIPSPLPSSQRSMVSLIWVSVCVGRWGQR